MAAPALASGHLALVHYQDDPGVWHTRLLLAEVDASAMSWLILTPDNDIYVESLNTAAGGDVDGVRLLGREPRVPYGIDARSVYGFRALPAGEDLRLLLVEAAVDVELVTHGGRHRR